MPAAVLATLQISVLRYKCLRTCTELLKTNQLERKCKNGYHNCNSPTNADSQTIVKRNRNQPGGCKKSCVYGEKSFLIGIRYVEIHCQISLLLCCRNSFLIIVLPVYLFLYTYIKFFAHQSGISRKEILCGRCPHPASRIRLDISGNTANADGIRPGHS